ncbi:hypothetical protein Q5P01_009549 [Channa striata]|uniref:Interleukin n=1 Tax=Channa striata TaxID=64152 RepID=A0AA88SSD0_CHASR|nr:hypothetical protein Q5P01_009549 [Channa striata]
MLRGTLSLVSVFLCFVRLLALTRHPVDRRCTHDLIPRVQTLIARARTLKGLDSRLYTPNITDHEQKCPSSALKCFAAEVQVLTAEWEEFGVRQDLHVDKLLRSLAKKFKQAESNCLQCELLQEENAEKFLNCLLSTLQQMNSLYCIQPTSKSTL